jgi:hypothetical protein
MKQFDNPGMMNPKKRSYFSGKKVLKNVKMFEEFVNEVTAEVSSPRKLRVPKQFEEDVMLASKLAAEIAEMSDKIKKISKMLQSKEESAGGIVETMEKYGANAIKVGKVLVELEKIPGKETKSWKGIAEGLEKLIPDMQKAVEKLHEANTHPAVEKLAVKYSIEESVVGDLLKSAGAWLLSWGKKIKEALPAFEESAEDLAAKVEDAMRGDYIKQHS